MPWHAFRMLEESFVATRELLLPFSMRRWVVLGVVAFFVSGTTGFNLGYNVSLPDIRLPRPRDTVGVPVGEAVGGTAAVAPSVIELLVGVFVLGFVVIVGLVVLYLAAVMEFVFVDIARLREIRIRGFFGASTGKGASLFFFRLAALVFVLGSFVMIATLTLLTGGLFLVLLVVFAPVLLAVVIGLWVVLRFTTDFVVPVMVAEDAGIIEGWRAFWGPLWAEWKQYGVYALVRFVLGVAAGIAVGIGAAAVAIVLLVPFGIVGVIGFVVLSIIAEVIAIVFLVGLALTFLLVLAVAVVVLIQVPVQTYLRYYGLFALGAITPEYDLVGDLRPTDTTEEEP